MGSSESAVAVFIISLIAGSIVLAFSVISFFGMGGFFIGAILGIVGGALALSLRPQSQA